jgi:2-oxoglutarate ferredoxin oxidoreductase subunit gamma
MREKTIIAGFGGQGIISMGQLWVSIAMAEGKLVSFFPYYGAEKRGGVARASCIVSDAEIASPLVTRADSSVAMSADALDACVKALGPGNRLIVNSTLVDVGSSPIDADGFELLSIPATGIAVDLGEARAANMVMLGFLAKVTGALALADPEAALAAHFPGAKRKFLPINLKALEAGIEEAGRIAKARTSGDCARASA